jgi:hypothetical protein
MKCEHVFPHNTQDYDDFISGAKHGVILFSLGYTGFSARDVPGSVISSFINAFAKLDQRIIMKFDPEFLPYIPDNVMVKDWIPQQDILGPNFNLLEFFLYLIETRYRVFIICMGLDVFNQDIDQFISFRSLKTRFQHIQRLWPFYHIVA